MEYFKSSFDVIKTDVLIKLELIKTVETAVWN